MHASSLSVLKSDVPDISSLQEIIGYRFNHINLLLEALTHKSFHHEHPEKAPLHNERLEFLGDSVLAYVIVEYLFTLKEHYAESEMSKVKSYVVKGEILSDVARGISLGKFLLLSKGEEDTGGRDKTSILANALEALIGAVYVDGGPEEARRLIIALFEEEINEVRKSGRYHDYKTEFQEECQRRFNVLPEYRVTDQVGEDHEKTFTVEVSVAGKLFGRGIGRNKKEAQMAAASDALGRLRSEA